MAKRFEFRFIDGDAPQGQMDADALIEIVTSLKQVALALARHGLGEAPSGRPTKEAQRIGQLTIGLAPGSTILGVSRSSASDELPLDEVSGQVWDERFEEIVEGIATDQRPAWVSDDVARSVGGLRASLATVAPRVEFSSEGSVVQRFQPAETKEATWSVRATAASAAEITFTGRLRVVNLDRESFSVTDDVGHKVAIRHADVDPRVYALIDDYVTVVGRPVRNTRGRLTEIVDATIEPAEPFLAEAWLDGDTRTNEELFRDAPTADELFIEGLTDEEAKAFLEAVAEL